MDKARLKRAVARSIEIKPSKVDILEAEKNEFKGSVKKYVKVDSFRGTVNIKKATYYAMDDEGRRIVKKPNIYVVALLDPITSRITEDHVFNIDNVKYEVVAIDDVDNLGVYYSFLVRRL